MSNFLTNIRLNNLQQEIDNLVLSGPLQNPLLTPLDCGGFAVENAAIIQAASIITPSFTTTGIIADSVATDTVTSKTSGGPVTFNSGLDAETGDFSTSLRATSFTQYTGGFNQVSIAGGGINCLTLNTDNIASNSANPIQFQSEANFTEGVTFSSVTFDDLTISDILTVGTVDPSGDTAGILRVSKIQPVLSSAGGDAATLDFDITNVSFDEITVQGSATFTQDVLTPLLKVGQITTNSPGSDMTLTGILSGGGTATITGMFEVFGTDIKGTTGSFTSIENISNDGPPQLSFGVDVNNHDISNIQNLEMFIDATNDIKIKANAVNPSTTYPSLGLTWTDGANPPVSSIVYDTVFNVPPSVAANSLAGILAINTSAGGHDITDGGDFSCNKLLTTQIGSTGGSGITIAEGVYFNVNGSVTAPNLYVGNTFITPAEPIGTVFDSHYNPPTAVAPVNYTNSPGLDFNFSIPGNIFNQKLVTFTLGQGIGNIFTLYIENFAFETKAAQPYDLNYVLYLDSSDMPVGNYFPSRTDKPLSYLNILDVPEGSKNYAFTQSILQTDLGESTGTVSLWVGATINTGSPLASFTMDFISLLGTLESTNSIGTTVTIS